MPERNAAAAASVSIRAKRHKEGIRTCLTSSQDEKTCIALDLWHRHAPFIIVLQDVAHEIYSVDVASLDPRLCLFGSELIFLFLGSDSTFWFQTA